MCGRSSEVTHAHIHTHLHRDSHRCDSDEHDGVGGSTLRVSRMLARVKCERERETEEEKNVKLYHERGMMRDDDGDDDGVADCVLRRRQRRRDDREEEKEEEGGRRRRGRRRRRRVRVHSRNTTDTR